MTMAHDTNAVPARHHDLVLWPYPVADAAAILDYLSHSHRAMKPAMGC
jgi:hypothetical protein